MVPQCDHQVIQAEPLEEYQFETERYIATSGLNIYDGSCWTMALALLGEDTEVRTPRSFCFDDILAIMIDHD
jgi:hypothetical protein